MITQDQIKLYTKTLIGKRIELIHTNDQYTKLASGTQGTINYVDSTGTIFAKWDDGSTLGLIPTVDKFKIIYD